MSERQKYLWKVLPTEAYRDYVVNYNCMMGFIICAHTLEDCYLNIHNDSSVFCGDECRIQLKKSNEPMECFWRNSKYAAVTLMGITVDTEQLGVVMADYHED
jgi:hypothetical protein